MYKCSKYKANKFILQWDKKVCVLLWIWNWTYKTKFCCFIAFLLLLVTLQIKNWKHLFEIHLVHSYFEFLVSIWKKKKRAKYENSQISKYETETCMKWVSIKNIVQQLLLQHLRRIKVWNKSRTKMKIEFLKKLKEIIIFSLTWKPRYLLLQTSNRI